MPPATVRDLFATAPLPQPRAQLQFSTEKSHVGHWLHITWQIRQNGEQHLLIKHTHRNYPQRCQSGHGQPHINSAHALVLNEPHREKYQNLLNFRELGILVHVANMLRPPWGQEVSFLVFKSQCLGKVQLIISETSLLNKYITKSALALASFWCSQTKLWIS